MDAETAFGSSLRRTRSTGDVPRRLSGTQRPEASRHADDNSDPLHQNQQDARPRSSTQTNQRFTRESISVPRPSSTTLPHTVGEENDPDLPGSQQHERSWLARTLSSFGIGRGSSRERRTIIALYFTLTSGFLQVVVISVVLSLAATRLQSPTKPGLTEWVACDRPLGVWAWIWVVRALLACSLTYWGFLRDRKARQRLLDSSSSGSLQATTSQQSRNSESSASNTGQRAESIPRRTRALPYAQLYSRLTLLSSLMTLSWFLTAHILEYTSINTCRHSSPHIWWLTFSILCLMYLSVLEVAILSLVVFVIAPILFLFWNVILICMGRHPLQTGNIINPEIGKLPKSAVDRIPLVIYIPPPPDGLFKETPTIPDLAHLYPPKPPKSSVPARKRFRFIRMLPSHKRDKSTHPSRHESSEKEKDAEKDVIEPRSWEEHWEKSEYPFVVLEGNRAACAICLMDFEEPKRLDGSGADTASRPGVAIMEPGGGSSSLHSPEPIITVTTQDDGEELRLADAGEGVQPLRLLECGHVFHKTCLDPWLTDVSGRCPVCQRAVVLPELKKLKKERR